MVDLSVTFSGVHFKNPVIPASGTFGFGQEFAPLYDLNLLGAIAVKGTTEAPRHGNPLPRISEAPAGMLNAVGLENPGIEKVLAIEIPALARIYNGPVILNVSGFSVEEYARCCDMADASPYVAILEVNISCPNVRHGGMSFGTSPESAAEIVRAVRPMTKKPLYVKLSPNVTDITSIARACEDAGADGLSLINTLLGMRINLTTRRPLLANTFGGLSGPAVFPIALRMVYQVASAVAIPVMGMGGVSSARDVIEMMLAGAAAVQVGAENLKNPYACKEILEALPEEMDKLGIQSLAEIVGSAWI
jgi:dihydroorotate dehydrogenase (NAD+) catalytic subunit